LNKKEFFGLVLVACFLAILLNLAIVTDFADSIAMVTGYLLTVTLLPFLLASLPSFLILLLAKEKLSSKQKLWLFLWPYIIVMFILVYVFYMLNYGGPL
jgi:hypothetical protein